jgi:hypothetical protein
MPYILSIYIFFKDFQRIHKKKINKKKYEDKI